MTSKVIVVVGASRGIGRELVHQFSAYKSNTVIALSRNVEAMEAQFTAENIHCAHLDSMDEDLHDALDRVLMQFPTMDIVVNNAGKVLNKRYLELTGEDVNDCYQTNAVGVMHATHCMVA